MLSEDLLMLAQRLQALAQAGITYATSPYDLERYEEIRTISAKLLEALTDEPFEKILRLFTCENGYQTPKVDIRGVVFRDRREVLLVREKIDGGKWTLPGGWADVGCTPYEVAVKEVKEEAGLLVRPVRLLALLDKRNHSHPPQLWYSYKVFIQCESKGGNLLQETSETEGAGWFQESAISELDLSVDRVTPSQLQLMFRFAKDPNLPAVCE